MEIKFSSTIMAGQGKYAAMKKNMAIQRQLIHFVYKEVRARQLIDYDDKVTVIVKPMPRKYGSYCFGTREIVISARRDIRGMINTLLHEMKHSEQCKQKRLGFTVSSSGFGQMRYQAVNVWLGKEYRNPTSHAKYLALPWEVEAREAEKFTDEIYYSWVKFSRVKS